MRRSNWAAWLAVASLAGCANGTTDAEGADGTEGGAPDASLDSARGAETAGDDASDEAPGNDDTAGDDAPSGDDGPATSDAGLPDGASDAADGAVDAPIDTGVDAGCSPSGVSFVPKYHSPEPHVAWCTAADAQAYYDACFGTGATTADCQAWLNANSVCAACLDGAGSDPVSSSWGPEVDWPIGASGAVAEVNVAGCLTLALGSQSTCATDLETLMECEHAACDSICGSVGFEAYQVCAARADDDPNSCKTYAGHVKTACASVASAACDYPPSSTLTFEKQILDAAKVFCE